MEKTKISFLAKACNNNLYGIDQLISDVKIDSRSCTLGDLFVCVVGEKNNGHDYVENAYNQGCKAFLMSDVAVKDKLLSKYDDISIVMCDNTVHGFEQMAKIYLEQFNPIKVAVTGSVGKTTTKSLIASVLSQKYNTVCTKKNLNSDLGVSLTCFLVDKETQAVVFEMGMDEKGQIKEYVDFVNPHTALITNVGVSHMEKLGSRDAIADAKLEIISNFNDDNTLIVNASSDYLKTEDEIRNRALNKSNYRIILNSEIEYIDDNGIDGIKFGYRGNEYALHIIGAHNAIDASLAIELAMLYGLSVDEINEGFSSFTGTERRLKVEKIGELTLIDDSYNASPDSMKAALQTLNALEGKRKIAVLSDMYELGDAEEEGHIEVGRFAAEKNVNILIAVGENSCYYSLGVSSVKNSKCNVIELGTNKSALDMLKNLLLPGDVVLIKGSNGTNVFEIAEVIRKMKF